MFSFLKKWSGNISEIKELQNELSSILARQGINFMHLHPEINKCLLGLAREVGSEKAVEKINQLMDEITSTHPEISAKEVSDALIDRCRVINNLAR